MEKRRKVLIGWISEQDFKETKFKRVSGGSILTLLPSMFKKYSGSAFRMKVRITIEEIGGKEAKNPQLKTEGGK